MPPRPQLSYSVQQRRAIADGLVADRENARYTDQVVRFRAGLSALPPPPAPPSVVAAAEPDRPPEPPAGATAADAVAAPLPEPRSDFPDDGDGSYGDEFSEDTLGDFVDQLARDPADEARENGGSPDGGPPAASGPDVEGAEPAGAGWLDWLQGLLGQADDAVGSTGADQVTVADAAPAAPVDAGPPSDAEAALTILVAETLPAMQPAVAADRREAAGDRSGTVAAHAALERGAGPEPAAGPPANLQRSAAAGLIWPSPPRPIVAAGPPAGGPPANLQRSAAAGLIWPGPPRPIVAAAPPAPGDVGIAIGDGVVAIEVAAPTAAARPPAQSRSAGRIAFAPGSADLPAGVGPQLELVLAAARAQGDRIRIVGEAQVAALALDRARAVALALVQLGAKAGELEMTLARDATGDQAQLLLAAPAAR